MVGETIQGTQINMDAITVHTLDLWFKVLKIYKLQNDANILKWVAYDSNFKPAKYDQGFKQWVKEGELESFKNLRGKYKLGTH